jgi:hypothetical protein
MGPDLKSATAAALRLALFCFAPVGEVYAADNSVVDQFLGSPLLILAAVIIVDLIAIVYHKMRR